MPPSLDACALAAGVTCSYCGEDGLPRRAACVDQKAWLECSQAGHARCWLVTPAQRSCD